MKYVLVLLVVLVAAWVVLGRSRGRVPPKFQKREAAASSERRAQEPLLMVHCAHCQVNLPQADALADGQQRLYCSEAHRAAGPR